MYRNLTLDLRKTSSRTPSEQDRNAIISTFYQCDHGKKGYLDKEDLKVANVALFGYKPSKVEVQRMLADHGACKNTGETATGFNLESFTNLMLRKMSASDEDDEIRSVFLAFDSQCRGFLTLSDLQRAVSITAPHLPSHAIETAFREIDRDGDGRVSYRDFEYMMKYDPDSHI